MYNIQSSRKRQKTYKCTSIPPKPKYSNYNLQIFAQNCFSKTMIYRIAFYFKIIPTILLTQRATFLSIYLLINKLNVALSFFAIVLVCTITYCHRDFFVRILSWLFSRKLMSTIKPFGKNSSISPVPECRGFG